MSVLVCAATASELGACDRGIRASGPLAATFETLLVGVGLSRAATSLARRLAGGDPPRLVVSSGLAGALSAGVGIGSWITATRIGEWRNGTCVDVVGTALRAGPPPAIRCNLVSSSHLVQGASPRYADDGSALAVDMESAALARESARRGVAFMVLRMVSDTPERPLPGFIAAFTAAMVAARPGSKFVHVARGVQSALADPGGVARIVRDGRQWVQDLASGWQHFARAIGGPAQ